MGCSWLAEIRPTIRMDWDEQIQQQATSHHHQDKWLHGNVLNRPFACVCQHLYYTGLYDADDQREHAHQVIQITDIRNTRHALHLLAQRHLQSVGDPVIQFPEFANL